MRDEALSRQRDFHFSLSVSAVVERLTDHVDNGRLRE
jgi:hypothetical protein